MNKNQLDAITAAAHEYFSVQNRARERALPLCRQMIQNSGNAIRSAHRQDAESARQLLDANWSLNEELLSAVADSDEIRQAGFLHDAQKEYEPTSRIGFGIDGGEETKQRDFEAVHGPFDMDKFVREVREHSEKIAQQADEMLALLNGGAK